jgi:hypothetical protein
MFLRFYTPSNVKAFDLEEVILDESMDELF